ncbi:MAG: DEAD/DEAH box helicase [Rubrobacter sp.]
MRQSPFDLSEDLKETLCQYLETSHKISHPVISRERAELLREAGVVSQRPFVETTPRFKTGAWLRDLDLPQIPEGFPEFVSRGLSTEKFPLYSHQEAALRAAWNRDGSPGSLIVASGTGSGKTECFYLPILADILREAERWEGVKGDEKPGEWRSRSGIWADSRRHEARPAAMRAIVLYPMNALVNDQLRRLRQTLDSTESLRWQRRSLDGNVVRFGRYTSQAELPGRPSEDRRRRRWQDYMTTIRSGWENVGEELRSSGGWPRPNGAEMLGRWDMQAAPPDILVTNYSMLEYMLLRPEEAAMFEKTRTWLASSAENVITLVLDEAHSYSGTQGTEVAYLIRRLFERLGARPEQIRCIATSATLGSAAEDVERVRGFASELFGQPPERFSVVQSETQNVVRDIPTPSRDELTAFAGFQRNISTQDTTDEAKLQKVCAAFTSSLNVPFSGKPAAQGLFDALVEHPRVLDVRKRTARRACDIGQLATDVWGELGDDEIRHQATAGILSAGTIAREKADAATPPLLPNRLHLMFRGINGLWACVDPKCPVASASEEGRPCGKLYAEPRVWCECSARVLEMFHCRICGLMFLGGLPDSDGRLWPYEPDLESGFQDYDAYQIFAAEDPNLSNARTKNWAEERRSTATTGIASPSDENSRSFWASSERDKYGKSPFACPRCDARGGANSNVVQAMRSTGPQALRVLMEQSFRNQPPRTVAETPGGKTPPEPRKKVKWAFKPSKATTSAKSVVENPNRGRKALIFSDGRQEAATLAVNMTQLHMRDLFRQLLLVILENDVRRAGLSEMSVPRLREKILELALSRGIDPTLGEDEDFWAIRASSPYAADKKAAPMLEAYLRREVADRQVGVESLGLARWVLDFEGRDAEDIVPPLEPFDVRETVSLIHAVVRILAGYDVLLPETGDPRNWPSEIVAERSRRLIVRDKVSDNRTFTWSVGSRTRLTRYLERVCQVSGTEEHGVASLMERLWEEYLPGVGAVQPASGVRSGWGVPLNRLAIAPMSERIAVCDSCDYLNSDTVRGVCVRCGGACREMKLAAVTEGNYYRKVANLALDGDGSPDPFPLRALEHTAQISVTKAATRERHFQDKFIPEGADREDAKQHRVDMLSVTTTMEMGIDIGDLTTVGLNGTPPNVANYQQRAGRAGRRSDSTATVVTFARDHSHDQYYYARVADIVTGRVRVPEVHLMNASIARRHLNSLVLQRFFTEKSKSIGDAENLFGAFGSIGDFAGGGLKELTKKLKGGYFRETVCSSAQNALTEWRDAIDGWLDDLPETLNDALKGASESGDLLGVLVTSGVLPRYAFPVDVVALWTEEPSRYNRGEEIQRDLQIALSEYAPDTEVVIDGWMHKSAGLYAPYEKNPRYEPGVWLSECKKCHHVEIRDYSFGDPTWTSCPMCGSDERHQKSSPAIRPLGFRTDWSAKREKYRGGSRSRAGSSSSVQLNAGGTASQGEPRLSERLWVNERVGELYSVNRGPDRGFRICPSCGRSLKPDQTKHKRPEGSPPRNCSGRPEGSAALYHSFQSNVAVLGIDLPDGLDANPAEPRGRAAWLSVAAAIIRAAASYLQIHSSEIAAGTRPRVDFSNHLQAEVFVYDTLPNGAGYASEVSDNIEEILDLARDLVRNCPEGCEAACYSCLLDYGNQRQHGLIDRHLAFDLLDYTLEGNIPSLSTERQVRALTKLRGFAPEGAFDLDAAAGIARLELKNRKTEIRCVHSLAAQRAGENIIIDASSSQTEGQSAFSEFDLLRRPFWVWNAAT